MALARQQRAWLIWAIAASFYSYGFFHRVAPAVIVDELMRGFALDATLLGTLSAAYFYTYAALQVPLGVLLDRFGPRHILAIGALAAACGGMLFAMASGIGVALSARALIGAGVAVGYIGTLKLVSAWFPLERFGLLAGLTLAFGTMGAITAQLPLALLVDGFGWRASLFAVGMVGLLLVVLIWTLVRDAPPTATALAPEDGGDAGAAHGAPPARLLAILARSDTWLLVLITGLTGAPILTFAGLWGVPYFVHVHGLERATAAGLTSLMLVAWAIGGPILGALAGRVRSPAGLVLLVGSLNGVLWLPFIFAPKLPLLLALPLIVALGLGGGAMIIAFSVVRGIFGAAAAGRALGIVNSAVLLFGAGMQTGFGAVLDLRWSGTIVAGNRVYDPEAYALAFALFAIAAATVVMAAFGLRHLEANRSSGNLAR